MKYMVLNTRHTGFVVSDLKKFIKFYEGFGLRLLSRMIEEGDYIDNLVGLKNVKLEWAKLSLPDGSLIELLKYHTHIDSLKSDGEVQLSNRLGCSHIALTVKNIDDAIQYICKAGGSIKNKYQISPDGNVKVAYCYDIEGNILEIVQELKL
jgi:catechol 2,3-dioxygenase-like lactoylglutathione lyase family enzyme